MKGNNAQPHLHGKMVVLLLIMSTTTTIERRDPIKSANGRLSWIVVVSGIAESLDLDTPRRADAANVPAFLRKFSI